MRKLASRVAFSAFLALLTLAIGSSLALADLLDPAAEGCQGKSAGDNCAIDSTTGGVCIKSTCSRLDYSHGSPPHGSVSYDCLLCKPGPPPAPAPPSAPAASGTSSAPPAPTPHKSFFSCATAGPLGGLRSSTAIGLALLATAALAALLLRRSRRK